MQRGLLIRCILCLLTLIYALYSYIDKQNDITSKKISIFELAKEIENIKEKNKHLLYEIEQFENPMHLMELARHPEYSHLKHPYVDEILSLPEGMALNKEYKELKKHSFSVSVGAK